MPRLAQKTLNIADVARAAGVSITTVSRVIHHLPTVTSDNRLRVEAAIRKLKFRPNVAAQRLAAGIHTAIFGLVIPQFTGVFQSFFALEVIKGVGQSAERLHADLLLHLARRDHWVTPTTVDGLLFIDVDGQEEFLDQALEQGIPGVVLNHYMTDLPVSCVAIDNALGAKQAVDHLVSLGHREIATITGDLDTQAGLERLDGFVRACTAHGLTAPDGYVQRADYTEEAARKAAGKLLSLNSRPTALFVASDEMALAAMEVARTRGLRVPEDLSVIGFDDNPLGAHSAVPLTTIHQPLVEMGQQGMALLLETREGKRHTPLKIRLPTRLVERQSCRQTWLPR